MTNNTTISEDNEIYIVALDLVLLLLYFCAIIANVLIIYVVLKHIRPRSLTILIILNWCVLDIIHLVTSPVLYTWYTHMGDIYDEMLTQDMHTCVYLSSEFGIMLLLLVLLFKDCSRLIRQRHVLVLSCVFCLTAAFCAGAVATRLAETVALGLFPLAFVLMFVGLFIATLAYAVTHWCNKTLGVDDRKLRLALIGTHVCLWFQLFVAAVLIFVFHRNRGLLFSYFLAVAAAFTECVSILNVYLLHRMDKDFRFGLYKTLRRDTDRYSAEINYVRGEDAA